MAAQLADRDLERRARAKRRFVEQHADVPAVQRVGRRRLAPERAIGFQLRRELHAALEINRVEVEHREEILASLRRWAHEVLHLYPASNEVCLKADTTYDL